MVSKLCFICTYYSFFTFDGAVKKIPCSVQDYVFDDINKNALNELSKSGFLNLDKSTVKVTKKGAPILNAILYKILC